MKKLILIGAGSLGTAAAAMALCGTGIASAAPDVVGKTYAEASQAISEDGGTATIATRVGDRLTEDECLVTGAWDAPFYRAVSQGAEFAEGEVLVSINCNPGVATSSTPGHSTLSPLGRAAIEQAEEQQAEEQALADDALSEPNRR